MSSSARFSTPRSLSSSASILKIDGQSKPKSKLNPHARPWTGTTSTTSFESKCHEPKLDGPLASSQVKRVESKDEVFFSLSQAEVHPSAAAIAAPLSKDLLARISNLPKDADALIRLLRANTTTITFNQVWILLEKIAVETDIANESKAQLIRLAISITHRNVTKTLRNVRSDRDSKSSALSHSFSTSLTSILTLLIQLQTIPGIELNILAFIHDLGKIALENQSFREELHDLSALIREFLNQVNRQTPLACSMVLTAHSIFIKTGIVVLEQHDYLYEFQQFLKLKPSSKNLNAACQGLIQLVEEGFMKLDDEQFTWFTIQSLSELYSIVTSQPKNNDYGFTISNLLLKIAKLVNDKELNCNELDQLNGLIASLINVAIDKKLFNHFDIGCVFKALGWFAINNFLLNEKINWEAVTIPLLIHIVVFPTDMRKISNTFYCFEKLSDIGNFRATRIGVFSDLILKLLQKTLKITKDVTDIAVNDIFRGLKVLVETRQIYWKGDSLLQFQEIAAGLLSNIRNLDDKRIYSSLNSSLKVLINYGCLGSDILDVLNSKMIPTVPKRGYSGCMFDSSGYQLEQSQPDVVWVTSYGYA